MGRNDQNSKEWAYTPLATDSGSIQSCVAGRIGKRIELGEFKTVAMVSNEAKGAADFQVNRSAPRDVIKVLMAMNLLVCLPQGGQPG